MSDATVVTAKRSDEKGKHPVRPLRIILPGGEGHLGRLLASHFSELGHQVTTLTRNPHNLAAWSTPSASAHDSKLWETVKWDGENAGAWAETLESTDVLINLAGRSVDCRYNAKNREEILRSRVRSTAVLGEAIRKTNRPPRVWLNVSTATIYRHSYDRAMDEATGEIGGDEPDAPFGWRFSIEVARRWEETFFSAQTLHTRKIAMRAAMVMSPAAGGIFEMILRLVRIGLGGAWGSGQQYMSWIHEEDFVRAVEHLIQREEIAGVVNLAAPVPLPNKEFMSALRVAWGIPFALPAREWMLTVGAILLQTETELLLKSRRVVPGILQRDGFEFRYPEWPTAARDLVRKYREHCSIGSRREPALGAQEESRE